MFYPLFEQIMLQMKENIELSNHERTANETLPDGFTYKELRYVNDHDPLHMLNLYYPDDSKETSTLPLIIDIHGGGWICGDKDTNHNYCAHLALGGNVVASLSYRTIDRCTIKEQIQDIFSFFHFLKGGKEQFGINTDKVFLTGDSAGAQLALLAFCVNEDDNLQSLFAVEHVPFHVKGLILTHGVYYLDEVGQLHGYTFFSSWFTSPGLERMIYGKHYKSMELYKRTCSPMNYIFLKTELPPVLLVTSSGDKAFEFHTHRLYQDLKNLGKTCTLYDEQDESQGHVFNIAHPDQEAGKKCNAVILQFVKEHA